MRRAGDRTCRLVDLVVAITAAIRHTARHQRFPVDLARPRSSHTKQGDEPCPSSDATSRYPSTVTSPDHSQSVENPLGVGGLHLHDWAFPLAAFRKEHGLEGGESTPARRSSKSRLQCRPRDHGTDMFGGYPGPWRQDPPWTGWWGDNPPYHAPVFVLTHHPRAPLVMQGGTTFTFVTEGIEAALAQARAAAGPKDISLAGGARAFQQFLAARLIDEINLSVVPLFLGPASGCSTTSAARRSGLNRSGSSSRLG